MFAVQQYRPAEDAADTVRPIGGAVSQRFSAGQLDRVLDALPHDLRTLLT